MKEKLVLSIVIVQLRNSPCWLDWWAFHSNFDDEILHSVPMSNEEVSNTENQPSQDQHLDSDCDTLQFVMLKDSNSLLFTQYN